VGDALRWRVINAGNDLHPMHLHGSRPRSGTFIYHSHVDEPRQHQAGLVGALVVRDTTPADPGENLVFVVKSASRSRQTNLSGPTMDGRWRACIWTVAVRGSIRVLVELADRPGPRSSHLLPRSAA
jgi:FtsP/CotA-like multicopper oxidase with cupredoxin domain